MIFKHANRIGVADNYCWGKCSSNNWSHDKYSPISFIWGAVISYNWSYFSMKYFRNIWSYR